MSASPLPQDVRIPEFTDQFARTRRFSLGVPQRFTVSPDGDRVLFVRTAAGDDRTSGLWLYAAGRERLLADPASLAAGPEGELPEEERIRRERAREESSGVVAYATDAEVRLAVFTLCGELWAVRTDGGAPWRVATAGPAVDPRPSPDGASIAYVTGGALRVVGTDGSADRALAEPEHGEVVYGLAEHAAAESMGRRRGHWWPPRGDALLVARVDTARVARWHIADPSDPSAPPRSTAYPVAGTANAEVTLHLLPLDGVRTAVRLPAAADPAAHPQGEWTDTAFEYVTAAGWDALGPFARVQTRDQRTAVLLAVDPDSGATSPLHVQHDAAWVELTPGLPGRTASGRAITEFTAEDGLRGLRIGGAGGSSGAVGAGGAGGAGADPAGGTGGVVSPAGVQVRELLGVVGEKVFFSANEDPTEIHVWRHDPGSGFVRLSEGPGVHTGSAGGDTLVLDSLTGTGRTVTVLRGGAPVGEIGVLAEEPVVAPRPVFLSLGRRALRSQLHLPSWHEPGSGPLPVLVSPYAGPQMQLVVRARAWWSCVAQWFAEQGFAVLVTDGRGTSGRGREWDKAVHGDRITPALDDQVDALHAAAERCPDLDLGAVAIRGWSYGGYLAAGAVLHRPEVFHAAVAGAPPTDRRLYDTHWEERFLGHPDVFLEAYERSSLVPYAHRLTRPLLLVHGVADDNVFFAHTLRLSAALLAAGRPHRVLPLSGATHRVHDRDQASRLLRLEAGFLRESLGLRPAPSTGPGANPGTGFSSGSAPSSASAPGSVHSSGSLNL